jgi:hypothetical protein
MLDVGRLAFLKKHHYYCLLNITRDLKNSCKESLILELKV